MAKKSRRATQNAGQSQRAGSWRILAKKLSTRGESVILLDDKYQSGTTMHYVAMQMQAAGVDGPILGLVAVKTLRDDDNKR